MERAIEKDPKQSNDMDDIPFTDDYTIRVVSSTSHSCLLDVVKIYSSRRRGKGKRRGSIGRYVTLLHHKHAFTYEYSPISGQGRLYIYAFECVELN